MYAHVYVRVFSCAYGPYKRTQKGNSKESEAGPPAHVINIPIAKPARAPSQYGIRGAR